MNDTATERYEMLINHAKRDRHWLTFQERGSDETHHQFILTCQNCDWWDGWDEPRALNEPIDLSKTPEFAIEEARIMLTDIENIMERRASVRKPLTDMEFVERPEIRRLRDDAYFYIHSLLSGEGEEFDNMYQILEDLIVKVRGVIESERN